MRTISGTVSTTLNVLAGSAESRRSAGAGRRVFARSCAEQKAEEKRHEHAASVHVVLEKGEVGSATAPMSRYFISPQRRWTRGMARQTLSLSCGFGCGAIRGEAGKAMFFVRPSVSADSTVFESETGKKPLKVGLR
jgi:hypothetical protein